MSKADEYQEALEYLERLTYKVKQFPNYQLQVNGVNYWASTGKWFDPATAKGGYSFNEFMEYLHESEAPKPAPEPKALALTDFEVALIKFIRSYPDAPMNKEHDDSVDALRYSVDPPWDM